MFLPFTRTARLLKLRPFRAMLLDRRWPIVSFLNAVVHSQAVSFWPCPSLSFHLAVSSLHQGFDTRSAFNSTPRCIVIQRRISRLVSGSDDHFHIVEGEAQLNLVRQHKTH